MIGSIWVLIARLYQSTQHNKSAISLWHLRKNVKDKVDFLSADKHQRFLQIGARCVWSDMPKLPKFSQFAISLQYLMKKVNNEVDFLQQISTKVPWKLIPWFLRRMVKHSQSFHNIKRRSVVFIVYFEHISHLALVFLLLNWNMEFSTGLILFADSSNTDVWQDLKYPFPCLLINTSNHGFHWHFLDLDILVWS